MTDTLIPDREQATSELADLRLRTDLFIDGDFRPARDGRRFVTENPATGQSITEVAEGGPADVDAAVAAARSAFERGVWSRMDPGARKRILVAWADLTAQPITIGFDLAAGAEAAVTARTAASVARSARSAPNFRCLIMPPGLDGWWTVGSARTPPLL